ncbi:MAG TPA: helix-turn-helix domain-containing protein, partial [Flavisolibacter sp.]|nr:helix-turn-helix domain-containing protein [Flavisolibacter sp.]
VVAFQADTQKRFEVSNLEQYKPVLERYMATEKPFLKQGYTINELSRDTGIPQHYLSALLNRLYEMRFNEYLNRLRINYISENLTNPEWEKLTLEGIAKQAGFTSRTTFFNTIKKTTGLSPSEFIEQIKIKPPQAT